MRLAAKIAGGVGALALVGAGAGVAAAVTSGSTPRPTVQVIAPSDASGSTTTTAPSTTTTTALPTTTTAVPAATSTVSQTTTTVVVTTTTVGGVSVPNVVGDQIFQANNGAWSGPAVDALRAAGLGVGHVSGSGAAGGASATGCYVLGATVSAEFPAAGTRVFPGRLIGVNC